MTWFKFSERKPPYFLVVEVHVDKMINGVMLDHAAYIKKDKYTDKDFWTFDGMDEYSYSEKGFGIKYWRFLRPLPNGKTAHMKPYKNGFMRVFFKKYQEDLLGDCKAEN